MTDKPVRVASIGMGWWSDVLADAARKTPKIDIVKCYTRSDGKREAFAKKYNCKAASSYEEILRDPSIEGVIITTPNSAHLETARLAAGAGKHVFIDKPIANTISDGRAITEACQKAGVILSVGYQRRRESHFRWIYRAIREGRLGGMVQAEANISRDRVGVMDPGSWRHSAVELPGGVMLQIGIHYVDILLYLLGPAKSVSAMTSHLYLEGENPDVSALLIVHENGAISKLSASYSTVAELYLFNVYGRDMTAFYSLHEGLRCLIRGAKSLETVPCEKNLTIVEELEEFADSIRGKAKPEVGGSAAIESLAVIRAGILSAREGRHVSIEEVLASHRE
jgi:predicted dehydrogenase